MAATTDSPLNFLAYTTEPQKHRAFVVTLDSLYTQIINLKNCRIALWVHLDILFDKVKLRETFLKGT